MAHKKIRTDIPTCSSLNSFPIEANAVSIATDMFNRVCVLGSDRKVRKYDSTGLLTNTISLSCSDLDRVYSIAIGIHEGESKEAMREMRKVPLLLDFPPGVLSICLVYLGLDCIFVAMESEEGDEIWSYDSDGQSPKHIAEAGTMTIDHQKGIIHTLDECNSVESFTYNGECVSRWDITNSHYIDSFVMINGVIYVKSSSDDQEEEEEEEEGGVHITLYQPSDGEIINTKRFADETTGDIICSLNDGCLVSVYRQIKNNSTFIHSYPFGKIDKKKWKLDPALSVIDMIGTGDGYSVYAMSESAVHLLVLR
jgi:hypothetical protein